MKGIAALIALVGTVIGVYIAVALNLPQPVMIVLGLAGFFAPFIAIAIGEIRTIGKLNNIASFDAKEFTLSVKKRDFVLCTYLKITSSKGHTFTYKPSETKYMGVTVGAVHVGSVYETGDSYKVTSLKTGEYRLYYYNGGADKFPINQIVLDGSIRDQAKTDPVMSKYLKDDGSLRFIGQLSPYHNMGFVEFGTTLEECKYMVNWLCGIDAKS